jgi:signal peptidase I
VTVAVVIAIIVAVAAAVLLVIRRRYIVISVDGISMRPALEPGERVLIRRTSGANISRGQIVVVRRPDPVTGWRGAVGDGGWYVKRAVAVAGDPVPPGVAAACPMDLGGVVPEGHLLIIGDNPRSDDSKQWGHCPAELLLGVYVRTLTAGR